MPVFSKKDIISKNQLETESLGREIGKNISEGTVICLYGEVGSGKTVCARGIAMGCGVNKRDVKSPSFTILNCYEGKWPVYHIDLYRIDDPFEEMEQIGYREILYGEASIVMIEWPDKINPILPENRIDIILNYMESNRRSIEIITRKQD